ncbi:MAG TPA: ROK family protein [Geobacteraceae bacterium]|nr:ROK family protein [Geobacteraceae bacterium]
MTTRKNGLCLAMDIGGTNVRMGLVTRTGSVVARRRIPCIISTGIKPFLESLRIEINGLRQEAAEQGEVLLALGGGIPGLIDRRGVVLSSVNLQPLEDCNLQNSLEEISGLPVMIINDANAATLAEASYGAGRPYSSLLHFTLGTGVGSGLILNGKLWTGIDGIAAEYGHATVEPQGLPCPCGNRGCLEQYASATAIARMAREGIASGSITSMNSASGNLSDAEELAKAAKNGDRLALSCFATAARYLGIAAATAVNLLNLEAIVIGGGVAQSYELLATPVIEEIRKRAFKVPAERVQVLKGELGDDAGMLGAAAAAWQMIEKS